MPWITYKTNYPSAYFHNNRIRTSTQYVSLQNTPPQNDILTQENNIGLPTGSSPGVKIETTWEDDTTEQHITFSKKARIFNMTTQNNTWMALYWFAYLTG